VNVCKTQSTQCLTECVFNSKKEEGTLSPFRVTVVSACAAV
jgi:hypothetical protein